MSTTMEMERPEICIPITDTTRDEIVARAREIAGLRAGLVEWRIDFFAGYEREVASVARELKQIVNRGNKKLIATLRTEAEGGEKNGSRFSYRTLLKEIATGGETDYLDVEIRRDRETVAEIIRAAGEAGVRVIGSYHDFTKTPSVGEIIGILEEAKACGADIGKLACMPVRDDDVNTLLTATEQMKKQVPDFPLITMSMGEKGKVSRRYGGLYGSSVSFACVGRGSAPGQIQLDELNEVFDNIYSGRRHISLIGFMGVGKSTISRELQRQTGRRETDTDARIVELEGCPIPQIFAEKGEPYFRQLETDMIDDLGKLPPGIISCGGGMAMRDLNVKKLRALGEIVLLTATPETIYERVKDNTNRPLLNGNMNIPYIRELMEKRRPFYEKAATVRVSTDGRSVREIAKEIIQKCGASLR